ncbi:MAG: electron transfer flavoprotein subunit beta/FixA family protein [Proteobacteria bacterium]|nr:electron transfer flavoprotein subunit beta/FixA family protein [Pseudomonadota bacterium]
MKILVTAKKVVNVELNIRVQDGSIVEDGLQYVINAWDENAVEAALVLKDSRGAQTTVVCIGDDQAVPVIRKAYAMGIERGIHVNDPSSTGADSSVFARILQKVYEKGGYDLVIMGRQSQDTDSGQTGPMLAEYTGRPCATNVVSLEMVDDDHLQVQRVGDTGREEIELELPAIVTVNDSANEPRLPVLKGIMQAKKRKIEAMDIADLGLSPDEIGPNGAKTEILDLREPETRQTGKKFEGNIEEIAPQVVGLLANEAKVL